MTGPVNRWITSFVDLINRDIGECQLQQPIPRPLLWSDSYQRIELADDADFAKGVTGIGAL